jgi:hypothetical protein
MPPFDGFSESLRDDLHKACQDDDRVEFWIKGNSATLTRDGKSESCETK